MRKNMKNRWTAIASAMLLVAGMTGCGGKNTDETTAATQEAATTAEAKTTEAPATQAPTTAEATTAAPATTEAPTTQAPTTEAPTAEPTEAPTAEPTEAPTTPPASETLFTKDNYPRVDGATAQYPMSLEIAKATMGLTQEEAEEFIIHHTTKNAYYNLIDKTVDVIFVSEPSDDILQRAEEAGVTFEMTGIGRDGFVFIVNENNPVESLTLDQIRDIYTGKITNWKEVGGEDIEICAYQREQNSGSQNLMEKMVMQGLELMEAPKSFYIDSMSGLIDQIAAYETSASSLGYSVYLYAKDLYVKDNVKFLGINGVMPSDATIASGEYPLSKIVYAVYRSDEPADSPVRKLCNWLLTEEGQEAVVAGGYTAVESTETLPDGDYYATFSNTVDVLSHAHFTSAEIKDGVWKITASLNGKDEKGATVQYPYAIRSLKLADDLACGYNVTGTGEEVGWYLSFPSEEAKQALQEDLKSIGIASEDIKDASVVDKKSILESVMSLTVLNPGTETDVEIYIKDGEVKLILSVG